mmetsp:Transcript_24946/g.54404  ORF Transcript_24946/g.54404 Transcript_24946/m.54404 type:complete len:209 (-) Transcript_24946:139-765(-)
MSRHDGIVSKSTIEEEDAVAMLLSKELPEISPQQLKHYPIRALVGYSSTFVSPTLPRDVTRGKATMRQPRRELSRVVRPEHTIARIKVYLETVLIPYVILNSGQCGSFTTLEFHHSSRIVSSGNLHLLGGISQLLQCGEVFERALGYRTVCSINDLPITTELEFSIRWCCERVTNHAVLFHFVTKGGKRVGHTIHAITEWQVLRIVHG